MGHDGTALWARDYETAALPLSYAGTFVIICLLQTICKHSVLLHVVYYFGEQDPTLTSFQILGATSVSHLPWCSDKGEKYQCNDGAYAADHESKLIITCYIPYPSSEDWPNSSTDCYP